MKVYFIATRHEIYRAREFEAGSTVIDPFRYIPDQPGVTVRRLGENKPALISLLVPSRGRAEQFADMNWSAIETAVHPGRLEIVTYLDDDDDVSEYPCLWQPGEASIPVHWVRGPRTLLSVAWNECYRFSSGEILMHCGDDIVFRTPGWDVIVRQAFADSADKILLVHGDDCSPNTDALATHGFLHRRWVETVGYFLPPYFSCDWNDVWLTEVADMIHRRVKVPIVTEHLHYSFDKRERDDTDLEREQRGRDDGVVELYKELAPERVADAAKLEAVLA